MPTNHEPHNTVEYLTGLPVPEKTKGRNIWGRVSFREQAGALHVEVLPGDDTATSAAMRSINQEDMAIGKIERHKLYRERCVKAAREINQDAVAGGKLKLLLAANGQLTRTAKAVMEVLER